LLELRTRSRTSRRDRLEELLIGVGVKDMLGKLEKGEVVEEVRSWRWQWLSLPFRPLKDVRRRKVSSKRGLRGSRD